MTIQVLVSTMNQNDYSLLEKMNIQTDAIVVNQCDKNEITEFEYKGHKIKWISLAERGVGLSRNTALMRSSADILIFADDDVVYKDGYANDICSKFSLNPGVDILIFNLQSLNSSRPEFLDTRDHNLNFFNSLKYGSCRIAARREVILKKNLYFSLMFGGGALYKAGEDNLYITEALKKKCKLIASNLMLGTVAQDESTWFNNGYDWDYYRSRGALFAAMYGRNALIMTIMFEIKRILMNPQKDRLTLSVRIKAQIEGMKDFRNIGA